MRSDPVADAVSALAALDGQRVWSLLVSVFGDLACGKGEAIDGPVLSAIMAALDIRPEATRVALHRLRNDGWLTSEKLGRTSRHYLTDHGLEQSAAASPRIYGSPDQTQKEWVFVMLDPKSPDDRDDMARGGFMYIAPRCYLGAASVEIPANALRLSGSDAPDWLRDQITPDDLVAGYAALYDILKRLDRDLPKTELLSPLQSAVLRTLIVHNWRRLVLRHPDLPAALYPNRWRGQDCRVLVNALLARINRPDLRDIVS
jgi:phenylacetic acid degradation operon negative regulatory protein